MISKILGALSWQQAVLWLVGTGAVYAIQHWVPAGDLQTSLLALDANLLTILTVIFRKPSANGGSVNPIKP
jgi:hypothetical protein